MASSMEYPVNFRFPTETLHSALVDEKYWSERLEQLGGPGAHLEAFAHGDAGTDITVVQVLDRDHLPPVAQKLFKDDLEITRELHFEPFARTTTGDFRATISVGLGHVAGTHEFYPSAGGCTWKSVTQAEVTIPLVGKKLEAAILDGLRRIYEREALFTADWIGTNR